MRFYYYWIALLVFVLDYATKKIIATQMEIGEQISVIGSFFYITSHRNRGAAFGILQDQRIFFIIITTVVLAGIIWYIQAMRKTSRPWLMTGLGLVLGGALGNFIDRIRFGEVVDFLQFFFGAYQFPIFNVADSGIVVGVILILIDTLLSAKDEKKALENEKDKGTNDHEQQPV